MGDGLSPFSKGEKVTDKATGEEVTVTDAGEFITHVKADGDRYPRPKGNDQLQKKD